MQFLQNGMNRKNFRFTWIPYKINDTIFLKSPNTVFRPFWTIFGHFSQMGIFSKKWSSVTHNYIWAPNMLSFRKNEWANSEKTYKQMEGWMERQMDPIL